MSQRILGIPLSIIGQGISQVYYGEISSMKRKNMNYIFIKKYFIENIKGLIVIGSVVSILLSLGSSMIVLFIIGKKWITTIYIIILLLPMYIVRFVFSPLSQTFYIFNKQEYQLIWNLLRIIVLICIFQLSHKLNLPFLTVIGIYSLAMMVIYLMLGILMLLLFRSHETEN